MTKTLVVTNDFPPRPGGIQAFVHDLALRRPPGSVVVYAPDVEGRAEFDAAQPFPVVRHPTSLMLPEPGGACAGRRGAAGGGLRLGAVRGGGAARPAGRRRCGAAAPGGSSASPTGTRRGGRRCRWRARLLRRIGDDVDVLTYLGEYTRSRMARGAVAAAAARMARLAPGVDERTFRAGCGGDEIRARHGLTGPAGGRVRVPAGAAQGAGRPHPRLAARPAAVPDAALLLVGGGPYRARLRALAGARRGRVGRVHRRRALGGAARPLRRGGRLRDAVPDPAARPGRRGPRDRLPGGVGDGAAGGGGRLRRRARRRAATARPGSWCRAVRSPAVARPARRAARGPGARPVRWASRAGPGWSGSGAGRSRPPGSGELLAP